MSYKIEPHGVLAYLNELGYKNISAQQLKEFIRDLKKLIKYDLRVQTYQNQENSENVPPRNADIFQNLYETRTAASKAKETLKKDKVISVQITKPKTYLVSQTCRHTEEKVVQYEQSKPKSDSTIETGTVPSVSYEEPSAVKVRPKSCNDMGKNVRGTDLSLKPKVSFIRPRMPLKPCKSDPVALYHQYQAEWKKQKFPGEDNHTNLRWAIRERMLGEPQMFYKAPSIDALSRKRCNSGRL